jgi:two-component system cell cycle response regulator
VPSLQVARVGDGEKSLTTVGSRQAGIRTKERISNVVNIETFEELKLSGNLPSPAGVGMRILELTRSEDYSAEDMGLAIMADSSLTGRILQLSNSAANAGTEPVTTVEEAIMRLGGNLVRNLALAFSLVSERTTGSCKAFDYDGYWSASLAHAVVAQALATRIGLARPEEAYICGLIGDVGRLALASVYSDAYSALLTEHGTNPLDTLLPKEKSRFKITHPQIGSLMLAEWGLPDAFLEATFEYAQCRSLEAMTTLDSLDGVLRVAYWIGEAMVADEFTDPFLWKTIGEQLGFAQKLLGLDTSGFSALGNACSKQWVNWGDSLNVATGNGQNFTDVFRMVDGAKHAKASPSQVEEDPSASTTAKTMNLNQFATTKVDQIRLMVVGKTAIEKVKACKELNLEPFTVRFELDGKAGLHETLKWGADIVLADQDCPSMDGAELCRSLRKNSQGEDLYLTVLGKEGSSRKAMEAFVAGADDFIDMPINEALIAARIKAGLRVCSLHRRVERDKALVMSQVQELGVLTRKLRATALTDSLTNLPNRRYAMKRLGSEWASVKRTGRDISLVMLDVDFFKAVNDTYGHDVGDEVLKETAAVIKAAVRVSDEACRIGGEEFLVICKNTDENEAMIVAERIRVALENHVTKFGKYESAITVSLGVASFSIGSMAPSELLKRADLAVYAAKHQGRNRSIAASTLADEEVEIAVREVA